MSTTTTTTISANSHPRYCTPQWLSTDVLSEVNNFNACRKLPAAQTHRPLLCKAGVLLPLLQSTTQPSPFGAGLRPVRAAPCNFEWTKPDMETEACGLSTTWGHNANAQLCCLSWISIAAVVMPARKQCKSPRCGCTTTGPRCCPHPLLYSSVGVTHQHDPRRQWGVIAQHSTASALESAPSLMG